MGPRAIAFADVVRRSRERKKKPPATSGRGQSQGVSLFVLCLA